MKFNKIKCIFCQTIINKENIDNNNNNNDEDFINHILQRCFNLNPKRKDII